MPVYSDSPASQDLLNRRSFAVQISSSIAVSFTNSHDSIVFGLNGIWGSGKSTLLGFLREELEKGFKEKEMGFITYQFNPWMFSGQENLQREFLEGLLENLNAHFKDLKDVVEWADNALNYLKFVKLIPKYGKDSYQAFEELIRGPLVNSVKGLKEKVDKLLIEKQVRLFVFIDDLDRLSPSEVVEIFQLVKLNSNFKNTFFFLAYDKEVVESALEIRFGENSKRYLEKIVQVDYKVPEVLPEIQMEIFFKELENFFNEQQISYDTEFLKKVWRFNGLRHYFRSLRDIYRYLNALYFRLPSIWKDINLTDFLILEAIRIFDYEGYEKVYRMEAEGHTSFDRYFEVNGKDERLEAQEFNPITLGLVRLLLRQEKGFNAFELENEKSFSDSQFLSRYFALQLSGFDISVWEFEDFLVNKNKRAVLEKFWKTGRLIGFFDHFANLNSFDKKFKFSISELYDTIFDFLNDDAILRHVAQKAFFSFGQILKSSKDYFNIAEILFNELVKDKGRLSFSKFLFIHWTLEDLEGIQANNEYEEGFYKKSIQLLEDKKKGYLDKWHDYIFSVNAIKDYPTYLNLLISCFADFFPEVYKEYMTVLLEKEEALLFLSRFLIMPNEKGQRPRMFQTEYFNQYYPSLLNDIFIKKLKTLFPALRDENDKTRIGFILNFFFPEEFPKDLISLQAA